MLVCELSAGDADDEVVHALVFGVALVVAFERGAAAVVVVAVEFDDHLLVAPEEVGGVVADFGV